MQPIRVLLMIPILILPMLSFAQKDDQLNRSTLDSLKTLIMELQKEVETLQSKQSQNELEELRKSAVKLSEIPGKEATLPEKTFQQGSRNLKAFNPEISLVSDVISMYQPESPHYDELLQSGFNFRLMDLNIQSPLDPFSIAKATVSFSPAEGVELEEAYILWTNPFPRTKISVGKFRQQFGIINRWHEHALDQIFLPLPLQLYLSQEGLNQVGISLETLLPSLTATTNELFIQITDTRNEVLFDRNEPGLPAVLVHFKNFYDLSPSTYLEIDLSGVVGTNDDVGFTVTRRHQWSYLGGVDVTLSWSPVQRALYKGFTWRSALLHLKKEQPLAPDIRAWGGYTYLDYKLSRRMIAGIRFDGLQPPEYPNQSRYIWQVVPYVTFWQSEFVFMRFQWNHQWGSALESSQNQFMLQMDWALGPHKHEKY